MDSRAGHFLQGFVHARGNGNQPIRLLLAREVYILDLTDLSFVFVVHFIRAHLRGASLGTRLSGDMER